MRRPPLLMICALALQAVLSGQTKPPIAVDAHGLIVQVNGDGGDTAQREGWAWLGAWIREHELKDPWKVARSVTFQNAMALLEVGQTGIFRRHPDQWNDPKDFSRDQTIPLIAAMGMSRDTARLDRLWTRTRERNFLAQNGDLFSPEYVNLFDRARGVKPGPIGDVQLGLSVWARIGQSLNNKDDVGDDLNLVVLLLMAKLRFSSESTESAINTYAKNRPISYGSFLGAYRKQFGVDLKASPNEVRRRMDEGIAKGWQPDASRVLGALRWYFRAESGGNPELAELYAPIVRRWLE